LWQAKFGIVRGKNNVATQRDKTANADRIAVDRSDQRFRKIIDDPAISIEAPASTEQPATEPSSLTTVLYKAMEKVFHESASNALVVPFLMRGATDGAYLRARGMAVYGVPVFRKDGELRMHGNDERISLDNLRSGTDLLRKIVIEIAQKGLEIGFRLVVGHVAHEFRDVGAEKLDQLFIRHALVFDAVVQEPREAIQVRLDIARRK
jgi:di/tripeptidase